MRKVVTILNFPESLMHEVRRDWPELQTLLRGLHHYFAVELPRHFEDEEKSLFSRLSPLVMPDERVVLSELTHEHRGLETLLTAFNELIKPWLTSPRPPSRFDIARASSLAAELNMHLERHVMTENERVLPLSVAVLTQDMRQEIVDEIFEREKHRRKHEMKIAL